MFGDLLLNREYLSVFLLSVRPTGGLLDKLRAINVELRRAVLECAWHVLRIRPVYRRQVGPYSRWCPCISPTSPSMVRAMGMLTCALTYNVGSKSNTTSKNPP